MAGDPTREAAFALLTAVFEQRRTLEDALNALPSMDPRDRSAAHRITAAVLRRTGTLDAVLEPLLRRAPPDPVRHVLRIGAAGLLFLAMPAHAAVGTAVALTRTMGLAPFAGLINAVLRKVAVAGTSALESLDSPRLDTPAWLWASWGKNARAIAEAHQHEAPLDLTSGPRATSLPASGLILPTGSLRFPVGTHVSDVPGFADGMLWVQDAAAALPVILLAPRPGERVADLCAAPGGKAAQLAASGAHVTAVERDPARLERLASNLRRWQLTADLVHADVLDWTPPELFDAVLLDAPCSATGTIRRHPDVPHLKRARDISLLARSQDRLLAAAARLLRPGGRLIYAVCSLQSEEGTARLAGSGLAAEPFQPDELPGLSEAISTDGFLRTYPYMWSHIGGMDGFFAARLTRH